MDFTTMVSNFKRHILEEGKEELEELSGAAREKVKRYIKDGTPGRHTPRHSFSHIFGDEETMRLIIPLEGEIRVKGTELFKRITEQGWAPAFTNKMVKQKLQRRVGDLPPDFGVPNPETNPDPRPVEDYEEEKEVSVLTMAKEEVRTIPKGPRAGEKITNTKKVALGKLIGKIGTPEDKQWWAQYQSNLNEEHNVQEYFLRPWMNDFKGVGEARPIIIISRHPIDVARMSDFSMTHSCHSEGSSHFHCAINESKGHGMVAYLVRGEDAETVTKFINDGEDEIFGDSDYRRFDDNPTPVGRVRIRKLFNPDTGEEFATVEDRVYGVNVPDFLPTVRKWARDTQEDMWKGKDGKMKEDFVNDAHWILLGGDYLDTEVEEQLTLMFGDTEWEQAAKDNFEYSTFPHDDLYDETEEGEDESEQAEERVGIIIQNANQASTHTSFYGDIEEGWDEMPWYISAGCGLDFEIQIDEEKMEDIPTYQSPWSEQREFQAPLQSVLEDYGPFSEYDGWEVEVDFGSSATDEVRIEVRGSFNASQRGIESVDELEEWCNEIINEMDEKHNSIKANLRAALMEMGYIQPGTYEKAVEEMVHNLEYENFQILYDENDPGDGIDILLKGSEDGSDRRYDGKFHKVIDNIPVMSPDGHNVAERLIYLINKSPGNFAARVRAAFKRFVRTASREAAKQEQLPFGDKYKRPDRTSFAEPTTSQTDFSPAIPDAGMDIKVAVLPAAGLKKPYQSYTPRERASPEDLKILDKMGLDLVYRFVLKIDQEVTEETYPKIRALLDYLDKNLEVLEGAIKEEVTAVYKKAAADVKQNVEDETKQRADLAAAEKALEKTGGAIPATLGAPVPVGEAKIREAIRRVIRKRLLKEEERGFETMLYQVVLQLKIDPASGGGIEQKLNRIRAIQGVTVVGHHEADIALADAKVIEAKIKFHPESDAMQPGTYVTRILVPAINISQHVPGVSVIKVIKGTLKRLDK